MDIAIDLSICNDQGLEHETIVIVIALLIKSEFKTLGTLVKY